jgi:hypothetical protein
MIEIKPGQIWKRKAWSNDFRLIVSPPGSGMGEFRRSADNVSILHYLPDVLCQYYELIDDPNEAMIILLTHFT